MNTAELKRIRSWFDLYTEPFVESEEGEGGASAVAASRVDRAADQGDCSISIQEYGQKPRHITAIKGLLIL